MKIKNNKKELKGSYPYCKGERNKKYNKYIEIK
jgi:hypothetical protein